MTTGAGRHPAVPRSRWRWQVRSLTAGHGARRIRRRRLHGAAEVARSGACAGAFPRAHRARPADQDRGDRLVLDLRRGRNARRAATYPSRLEAELKAQLPGLPITVLNKGIGGEEAPQMVARFDADVIEESARPRAVAGRQQFGAARSSDAGRSDPRRASSG